MSYSFVKDPNMVKELLLEREKRNIGGVECMIVGKQGCGKTTWKAFAGRKFECDIFFS